MRMALSVIKKLFQGLVYICTSVLIEFKPFSKTLGVFYKTT